MNKETCVPGFTLCAQHQQVFLHLRKNNQLTMFTEPGEEIDEDIGGAVKELCCTKEMSAQGQANL